VTRANQRNPHAAVRSGFRSRVRTPRPASPFPARIQAAGELHDRDFFDNAGFVYFVLEGE
jgi:hypothetical protein